MQNNLCAVIVETRPLTNLKKVIEDHLKFLPDYTNLYVFGSIATEQIVKDFDCKFIRVDGVINEQSYNKLLTSVDFWNMIEEENILIFQHDSELLRTGIEEFYEWDYVGAPWKFQYNGGNGGLSFRKKSAMLHVVNNFNCADGVNEDVFFSNCLHACGKKLAPRNVCQKFSCETIFQLGTLGAHAIEKHLNGLEVGQIRNQYAKI